MKKSKSGILYNKYPTINSHLRPRCDGSLKGYPDITTNLVTRYISGTQSWTVQKFTTDEDIRWRGGGDNLSSKNNKIKSPRHQISGFVTSQKFLTYKARINFPIKRRFALRLVSKNRNTRSYTYYLGQKENRQVSKNIQNIKSRIPMNLIISYLRDDL